MGHRGDSADSLNAAAGKGRAERLRRFADGVALFSDGFVAVDLVPEAGSSSNKERPG
jgi:hypothetical protein